MSITIQTNSNLTALSNHQPKESSRTAQIMAQIQQLTERLGKISSEKGMTTEQKKEMAELIQKQIESLEAELEQLLRKQTDNKSEKKGNEHMVQADENQTKDNNNNMIDIYVQFLVLHGPLRAILPFPHFNTFIGKNFHFRQDTFPENFLHQQIL